MSNDPGASENPYGQCAWTSSAGYRAWSRHGEIRMFGSDGHRATDVMLISAAACLGFVMVEYAKNRALPVTDVHVSCDGKVTHGPERIERITTTVTIGGDISDAERRKMLKICELACKVMNTLKNTPEVETVLAAATDPAGHAENESHG
jgi:putative redox protein